MRQSIGGAWIMGIVIVFMSVLIAYISISINYKKAFDVKTKLVTAIEQYDGVNPSSAAYLTKIMRNSGYRKTNSCAEGLGGRIIGLNEGIVTMNPTTPQQLCITREKREGNGKNEETKYYYAIETFFGFELPVMGNIFTFRIQGETNAIYYPSASDYFG